MLVEEHHAFDPKRFIGRLPGLPERYGQCFLSQIDRADALVLVAERESAVAGYAYATVEGSDYMALRGPAGVLQDLVVDPGHRRQGIGTALLDASIAGARQARGAARGPVHRGRRMTRRRRCSPTPGFGARWSK